MFDGFVGLIAMSSSLSPLSSCVTFTTFCTRAACAADTPTASISAAAAASKIFTFTRPSPRSLPVRPSLARSGGLGHAVGCGEQLVPRPELDPGPAELFAGRALELVDGRPAGIEDGARVALGEQRFDRFGRRLGVVLEPSGLDVLEQARDGL